MSFCAVADMKKCLLKIRDRSDENITKTTMTDEFNVTIFIE